jgi:NADPH:quinone reductase-like Zn-dependent oxidoreductase
MPDVPEELKPPFALPLILGTDISGVVAEVAEGVDDFAVGDEVIGLVRFPDPMQSGAYAEYVAVPAGDLGRKPIGTDHVAAAGLPMSGLTAWQFIIELGHDHPSPFQEAPHRPLPLDSSTTVLVNGAAGGVGHLAVQLAKWRGARVIAVASGAHEAFLRELGVDEFIDYTQQDAADVVRDVDVVLDNVGGPTSRRFLTTLKRGGHLYPVYFGEFDAEENERLGITVTATQVRASGAQLDELSRLVDAGVIRVAVDSTYPLAEAAAAHERADRGHIQGKIVLEVA